MAKGKINSFFVAAILAVVSFFVIFLFFPEASARFFGVSLKHGDVSQYITSQQIFDNVTKKVTEQVTEKVVDTVKETVKDVRLGEELKDMITSGN